MRLTEITDDLTGAADSGSYFTARGRKVRICTNGRCSLEHETDEILTVNLSSRNTAQDKARQLHADLLRRLEPGGFYMKKIGTGFRGNDSYELDGLLDGWPDYNVFIVDNAPDLGTFTLYGNQYCEGEILPKSVYANDPIFPPTESYIPKILGKDTDKKIGLVDIDAVKGSEETLLAAVEHQLAEGTRILDVITHITELNYCYSGGCFIAGAPFWEKLSDEDKAAFKEAAQEASDEFTEFFREKTEKVTNDGVASGQWTVDQPSDDMKAKLQEIYQQIWEESRGSYSDEIMDAITSGDYKNK